MTISNAQVLQQYQEIAALSSQMLVKAQSQEWDGLIQLGNRYQAAVRRLQQMEPLGDGQRAARLELLTRILDDDAKIRELISPELNRLSLLLGNFKRQRNVLQTYYSTVRPG